MSVITFPPPKRPPPPPVPQRAVMTARWGHDILLAHLPGLIVQPWVCLPLGRVPA